MSSFNDLRPLGTIMLPELYKLVAGLGETSIASHIPTHPCCCSHGCKQEGVIWYTISSPHADLVNNKLAFSLSSLDPLMYVSSC